jgi:hypothetical protein
MSTNIQVLPGKVGISNISPIHTLDIGSNVYVDDTAENKLTVVGKIYTTDITVASNLQVMGTTTVVNTENLSIKDPIIELARDSVGTGDTGILMKRAVNESNVAIFYDEGVGFKIAHTMSGANGTHITVDAANTLPISLHGNVTVTSNLEVGTANLFVDTTTGFVGVGTAAPGYALDVVGTTRASQLYHAGVDVPVRWASVNSTAFPQNDGEKYWKIATFTGAGGNYGRLQIIGTLGSDISSRTTSINAFITTRGGFSVHGNLEGYGVGGNGPKNYADIVVYEEDDGTHTAYLKTNNYYKFDILLLGGTVDGFNLITTFPCPEVSGTNVTPTGTLVTNSIIDACNVVFGSNGNVGIGTTSPSYKLDVHGTSNVGALTATTLDVNGSLKCNSFTLESKPGNYGEFIVERKDNGYTQGHLPLAHTTPFEWNYNIADANYTTTTSKLTFTIDDDNTGSRWMLKFLHRDADDPTRVRVRVNTGTLHGLAYTDVPEGSRENEDRSWTTIDITDDVVYAGAENTIYWWATNADGGSVDAAYVFPMSGPALPNEPVETDLHLYNDLYVRSNLEVGTANLFVDTTTGNVGIGTASPGGLLDINGFKTKFSYEYRFQDYWTSNNNQTFTIPVSGGNSYGVMLVEAKVIQVAGNSSAERVARVKGMISNYGVATHYMTVVEGENISAFETYIVGTTDTSAGTFTLKYRPAVGYEQDVICRLYLKIWYGGFTTSFGDLTRTDTGSNSALTAPTFDSATKTFGGNVGIGTASPGEKLHVNGNLRLGSSSNNTLDDDNNREISTAGQLTIKSNDSGLNANYVNLGLQAGNVNPGQILIGGGSTDAFKTITFHTSGSSTERMRIHHNGNVGIGTTSPQGLLHLSSGTSGDAHLIIEADTDNNNESDNPKIVFRQDGGFYAGELGLVSNHMVFRSKSSTTDNTGFIFYSNVFSTFHSNPNDLDDLENTDIEVMRITGTGNVGIGTDAPAYKLDVHGTSNVGALTATTGTFSGNVDIGATRSSRIFIQDAGTDNGTYYQGLYIGTPISTTDRGMRMVVSHDSNTSGNRKNILGFTGADLRISNFADNNTLPGFGTTLLTIESGGDVGIGTAAPAYKLDVHGTSNVGALTATSGDFSTTLTVDGELTTKSDVSLGVMSGHETEGTLKFARADGGDRVHNIKVYNSSTQASNYMKFQIHAGGASAGTLTDNVLYLRGDGNVGIGTDTPAQKLDVAGRIRGDTMEMDSYMYHVGDDNTYFGFPANDTFTITTSNTERLRVDSSGNVGIGTTNPQAQLHISSGTSGDCVLRLQADTDNNNEFDNARIEFISDGSYSTAVIGAGQMPFDTTNNYNALVLGALQMKFYTGIQNFTDATGMLERMTIDEHGNVGIGTSSPSYKLDVHGTSNVGALTATTATVPNDGDFVMGGKPLKPAAGLHWDRVNSRLGVGTTNPLSTLQVGNGTSPTTGDASGSITVYGTGATKSSGGLPGIYHRANVGLGLWSDYTMSFEVNGTTGTPVDAMRITNTGNVGIGTTNPSAKLDVNGVIKNQNPCFHAYLVGAASTSTTGVFNGFTSTYVNRGSHYYTSGANQGKFIAPVAGVYRFSANMLHRYSSAASSGELTFYKNGTNVSARAFGYTQVTTGGNDHDNLHIELMIELATDDYIQVAIHAVGSGTDMYTGESLANFRGFLIG